MTKWKELSEAEYDAIAAAAKTAIAEIGPQVCKRNDDEEWPHGDDWPAYEKCMQVQEDDWGRLMGQVRKDVGGNLLRRNFACALAFDVFKRALGWHGWAITPWVMLSVSFNMQEREKGDSDE